MKFCILILSGLTLFSCTDTRVNSSADSEINQQSVVQTDFDNSALYQQFNQWRAIGPVIPGLLQPLVPQGMAYWEEQDLMIISNYMSDDSAGALTFLTMDTELLEKTLFLYNKDGTPHKGHLGGLTISRKYLWIASDSGIYNILLESLISTGDREKIYLPELIETETKGSFATFHDNVLWIGEFTLKNGNYPVSETHHLVTAAGSQHRGWLGGFTLNDVSDLMDLENIVSGKVYPDFILSIPDKIQGAVFFENKIVLSESYGRKNYSRLHVYDNPLSEPSQKNGDRSFWFLNGNNKTGEIIVPPMSEAVVLYENNIAVLFESAADKYRDTALFPLDCIQFLPIAAFNTGHRE
jgi:hypothetical protein